MIFRKRFADFNLFLFLFSYFMFILANDNTQINLPLTDLPTLRATP